METKIEVKQKLHYAVIKDFRENEPGSENNWQAPVYSRLYIGTNESELSDLVCGFLDLFVDEDKAEKISGSRYTASKNLRQKLGSFVRKHTVDDFDKELIIKNDEYSDIFDQDMTQVQIVYGSQEIINEINSWSRNTFTIDILNLVEMLQNKYRLEFQLDDEESSYDIDEWADEKVFYRYNRRYVGYYYEYDEDGDEIHEPRYFTVDDYNFYEGNLVKVRGDLYELRR
mgnify:CR=1 FL=1